MFGVALHNAIARGQVSIDFKGVALGDSWIDPVGCMYSYPPFLKTISLIDAIQADNLTAYAEMADSALQLGLGNNATFWWGIQQNYAEQFAGNVNIYNFQHYDDYTPDNQLNALMNGPVIRQKLGIIPTDITWGGQAGQVFEYMGNDFMKTGIRAVEILILEGYQVAVYSGQLDIIVDVICIDNWIKKLQWSGLNNFLNAPRQMYNVNGVPNGYSKSYQNFSLWNILNAGHMVPYDNGPMALQMLENIIQSTH